MEVREQAAAGIRLQMRELEKDVISVGGIDTAKAPIKGGGNAQERRLCQYLDRKTKLEQRERELREMVEHTKRALESLPARERAVLVTMYMRNLDRGAAVRRLEETLYVCRATVYRIRDRALYLMAYRMGYL